MLVTRRRGCDCACARRVYLDRGGGGGERTPLGVRWTEAGKLYMCAGVEEAIRKEAGSGRDEDRAGS